MRSIGTSWTPCPAALRSGLPSGYSSTGSSQERAFAASAKVLEPIGTLDPAAKIGAETLRRRKAMPNFGAQKENVYLAVLGKRLGIHAPAWREASALYLEVWLNMHV